MLTRVVHIATTDSDHDSPIFSNRAKDVTALPRGTTRSRRCPRPASGLIQNPLREPPCARR